MIGPIPPNFSSSNYSDYSQPPGSLPTTVPTPAPGCPNYLLLVEITKVWTECNEAYHYLSPAVKFYLDPSSTTGGQNFGELATKADQIYSQVKTDVQNLQDQFPIGSQYATFFKDINNSVTKMDKGANDVRTTLNQKTKITDFQNSMNGYHANIQQSLWDLYTSLS